jgi:glycosyltransferase involved in cell wall biosynthesis
MDERPELVHLFKPKGFGGLAAMLHMLLLRLGARLPPLFVDTDDWEGSGGMNALHGYSRMERLFFRFQEQWLLPRAAGVTVASRTLQTQAWGMGIAAQRTLYLPNGVDDLPPGEGKRIRAKLGIPADAPVVLLYTRFFEFDQERLHRIFAGICSQVQGVRFLVVGKGRSGEEEQLLEAAKTLGFAQALCMAGWVEPQDIPDYLAAGDVAIYPFADTLVNRAKCPAKLAEIMRAAVPVVADNVGQLAEYIRPEVSGLLCTPDDWQEMAARAVELLRDGEKRRLLGENGRRRMLEEFSWNGLAAQLNGFYTGERL